MARILLLLTFLVFPAAARGGISAPNSSVALSPDGTKILVMLSPYGLEDHQPTAALPGGRVVNLHDTFPKSGVYEVSTLKPVWQVEWFAFQRELLLSDDFRHIMRLNRQGFRSTWAIAFYDEGRLVRKYNCRYLLNGLRRHECLPFTTGDWHTQWYDRFGLSADRDQVLLSTARRQTYLGGYQIDLGLQEFYTFDLASGSLVRRRSVGAWRVWAYGAASVTFFVGLVLAVRLLWRKVRTLD